jgi:hypothetical protein
MCNCKDQNQCKCLDGKNAFTKTTASFIQPACDANVTINVKDAEFAVVGQPLFIENGGQYEVVSKTDTTITIKNLCGRNNVAAGLTISSKSNVSPSGFDGLDGEPGECDCPECNLSVIIIEKTFPDLGLNSTVTGGTGAYTYLWQIKSGPAEFITINGSATNSNVNFNLETPGIPFAVGDFLHIGLVKLTVTDSVGCKKEEYYNFQYILEEEE